MPELNFGHYNVGRDQLEESPGQKVQLEGYDLGLWQWDCKESRCELCFEVELEILGTLQTKARDSEK